MKERERGREREGNVEAKELFRFMISVGSAYDLFVFEGDKCS